MHTAQEYNHFCVQRKNAKLQPVKKDPFQSRKYSNNKRKLPNFTERSLFLKNKVGLPLKHTTKNSISKHATDFFSSWKNQN